MGLSSWVIAGRCYYKSEAVWTVFSVERVIWFYSQKVRRKSVTAGRGEK
jgi:hypothetical protein